MSYENLAAKYRPKNLTEVLGQETIKTTLANSVKLGRLAHSYVFYGPRGCGKTTIARILAKTLNCPAAKDGKPCDKCASCLEIAAGKSLDVIEMDAASHTDVDNVRELIIDNVGLAPSRDKFKIYILDEVHMLSKQSFNALLKTIEEPPDHVVFIMATTEQAKVPVTIMSRSQCFRFRPISEELIAERLGEIAANEKLKASGEALALIARSAGGAVRDAFTLLDRAASFGKGVVELEILNELLGHAGPDLIRDVAVALVKRDAAALYLGFERIAREGYDPVTLLRDLRNALAETFLHLHGFSKVPAALSSALGKDCPPATLARLARKLNVVIEEIKFSDAPALAAEIALFTLVETPQDLDALVRRLETLEGRLATGAPAPAASAAPGASEQKKNEKPALTPPSVPASRGPSPESRTPSPELSPSALWKKLLGIISSSKPMLYNILLSTRVSFDRVDAWTLCSATKFEANIVEKARVDLEGHLEREAGRRIGLTITCNSAPQPSPAAEEGDDVIEQAVPEEADDNPAPSPAAQVPSSEEAPVGGPNWEDADGAPADDESELKHLKKVFHGRITRIQKVVKKKV
jgi:DNA polymerase-3 subunit gamma/tau